jgi:hypothetical protein
VKRDVYAHHIDKIETEITNDPKLFWCHVQNKTKKNAKFQNSFKPPVRLDKTKFDNREIYNTRAISKIEINETVTPLATIKVKNTVVLDGIPAYVVIEFVDIFASPLPFIFVLSVSSACK